MRIADYFHDVQHPAYVAISAMTRAGLPVSRERVVQQQELWQAELEHLEKYVVGTAAACGLALRYSPAHSALPEETLHAFLFGAPPRGLGLAVTEYTETGAPSTNDKALMPYAAIGPLAQPDDHPVVQTILQIRSIAKARGTHLQGFLDYADSQGFIHAKVNWNKERTVRLSVEQPPLQQIPERHDPAVAKKVKACLVPRDRPWLGDPDAWSPDVHGYVFKADVSGAEALIRAGVIARDPVATPFLRDGGDLHSNTASIMYGVPHGTYTKGSRERDVVGKQGFFGLQFGGSWATLQNTYWEKARLRFTEEECIRRRLLFFSPPNGYVGLALRYLEDARLIFSRGYIEDLYGRRWSAPPPPNVLGMQPLQSQFPEDPIRYIFPRDIKDEERREALAALSHLEHIYANRPTQSAQASTTLWSHALLYHGEYVELIPTEYVRQKLGGLPHADVADYALHEGPGPGGKPLRAWISNSVHDAIWGDGAPGTLAVVAKLIQRRFLGVPADFLLEANLPWRVELQVGPDYAHLCDYNDVAKRFGYDPLPEV